MAVAIKLPDELVNDARLGKIAEENPDLPLEFIRELMLSHEETRQGKLEPYIFGLDEAAIAENGYVLI